MTARLEHANLVVENVDAIIQFLVTAFPEFRMRHDAIGEGGQRWVHIGTDETYIALNEATQSVERRRELYSAEPGVNHLGYEVDDVDGVRERLLAAGYRESTVRNAHPHRKRIYFYDPEGNDWEFVQYLSSDPIERNDYKLPDQVASGDAGSQGHEADSLR